MVVRCAFQRDLALSGLWHGSQFKQVSAEPIEQNSYGVRRKFDEVWVSLFLTFITWESKTLSETLPDMVPERWFVFRVRQSDGGILYLDTFDARVDDLEKVKTRKEAEKIIRRHVNDPEFYSPFMELHKVPESDYERVSGLMEDFGISF